MNDRQIMELFFARAESAIAVVSQKYEGYCYSISYAILGDEEDVRECLNDTWLHAWNAIPPAKPENLSLYLGKITRNLSINQKKKKTAQKRGGTQHDLILSELEECIPAGEGVEDAMENRELKNSLEVFIRSLPGEKRGIFVRRYFLLRPIGHIAREFGMSESKVTSMLYRMRNALKNHLEKEGITL